MPWRLLGCQAEQSAERTPTTELARRVGGDNRGEVWGRAGDSSWRLLAKERRASKEGGGSPMPASSRPALRRTSLGCREEAATEARCRD